MIVNDDNMNSDQVAELLEISGSNVRKYSAALQKEGYHYKTDNKKKRYYTYKDYEVLQQLKYLIQIKNLSLETAAKTVIAGLEKNRSASGAHDEQKKNEENNRSLTVPHAPANLPHGMIEAINEQLQQQREINKELLNMLEHYKVALEKTEDNLREIEEERRTEREQTKQYLEQFSSQSVERDKRIEERMEKRDKALTENMRLLLERNQQQLLEVSAAQDKEREKKKGFLARLLGR